MKRVVSQQSARFSREFYPVSMDVSCVTDRPISYACTQIFIINMHSKHATHTCIHQNVLVYMYVCIYICVCVCMHISMQSMSVCMYFTFHARHVSGSHALLHLMTCIQCAVYVGHECCDLLAACSLPLWLLLFVQDLHAVLRLTEEEVEEALSPLHHANWGFVKVPNKYTVSSCFTADTAKCRAYLCVCSSYCTYMDGSCTYTPCLVHTHTQHVVSCTHT